MHAGFAHTAPPFAEHRKKKTPFRVFLLNSGASKGARTLDLSLGKAAL